MIVKTITLTALAIILVLGGTGFQIVTSQPGFCNSCHEMDFNYRSWQSSTHATKAVCLDCHSEPGIRGFISEKIRGMEQLSSHLSGNYKVPIRVIFRVKNDQCLACHPETRNLPDKSIEAKHSLHMNRSVLCADCHNRMVHNKSGQSRVMTQDQCETCHQAHANFKLLGRHATLNCDKCHINGIYKGTAKACINCHKTPSNHDGLDTDCIQCHNLNGFKPETFMHDSIGEHMGRRAEEPLSCNRCHPIRYRDYTCIGSQCHSSNNPEDDD